MIIKVMGFLFAVFFFFLVSCNFIEIREQEFKSIKKGMTKSQVLGMAGSPHWSDRKSGRDRWFYYMNPHDRNTERVVYFKNNKVVEKGYRKKPSEKPELLKKDSVRSNSDKSVPSEEELREIIKEEIRKKSKPVKFERI